MTTPYTCTLHDASGDTLAGIYAFPEDSTEAEHTAELANEVVTSANGVFVPGSFRVVSLHEFYRPVVVGLLSRSL